MINAFCQYSHGVLGFRVYHIDLTPAADLNDRSEVNFSSDNALPRQASTFFRHGGVKVALLCITNNKHCLVIRDIPSQKKDDVGRDITCVAMFIGDADDYNTLVNLTLSISDNLSIFESFFANLFYVKQGLKFEGDTLLTFIESHSGKFRYFGTSPLLKVLSVSQDGVQLLVPLSPDFSSKIVQAKVYDENGLTPQSVRSSVIIPYKELLEKQNLITREKDSSSAPVEEHHKDERNNEVDECASTTVTTKVTVNPDGTENKEKYGEPWDTFFNIIAKIRGCPLSNAQKDKVKCIIKTATITTITILCIIIIVSLKKCAKN